MLIEEFEKRIHELKEAVDKSAANHNTLVGRLQEAMFSLSVIQNNEKSKLDKKEE